MFYLEVVKSMLDISENSPEQYEGEIQEHGSGVDMKCCLACVLASAVKSKTAIWEQASSTLAMQVQCAQSTSPVCFIATQAFKGVADSLCECFTDPINKKPLILPP